MLSEFEADTADYILSKFAFLFIVLRETKWGYSVKGQYKGKCPTALWMKYKQVVVDARIRLPGSFVGGKVEQTKEGYLLLVEIY